MTHVGLEARPIENNLHHLILAFVVVGGCYINNFALPYTIPIPAMSEHLQLSALCKKQNDTPVQISCETQVSPVTGRQQQHDFSGIACQSNQLIYIVS